MGGWNEFSRSPFTCLLCERTKTKKANKKFHFYFAFVNLSQLLPDTFDISRGDKTFKRMWICLCKWQKLRNLHKFMDIFHGSRSSVWLVCDILPAHKLSDLFLMITEKIQFHERRVGDKEGKSKIYWQKLMLLVRRGKKMRLRCGKLLKLYRNCKVTSIRDLHLFSLLACQRNNTHNKSAREFYGLLKWHQQVYGSFWKP